MSNFAQSYAGRIYQLLVACSRIACCVLVGVGLVALVILIRPQSDLGVKASSHPAKSSKKLGQLQHLIGLHGGVVTWPVNGDPSTMDIAAQTASGNDLGPQALANLALSRFVGIREDEALPDAASAHVYVFVHGHLAATGTMSDPGDHYTPADLVAEVTGH
jgi:hypothetical protein